MDIGTCTYTLLNIVVAISGIQDLILTDLKCSKCIDSINLLQAEKNSKTMNITFWKLNKNEIDFFFKFKEGLFLLGVK